MTMLRKLELDFCEWGEHDDEQGSYFLPSYRDPKATITHACWIIESNPHLLDLKLDGILLKDHRDAHLLTRSISGLRRLQYLTLEIVQWEEIPEEETQQFRDLETLYQQLGALTELEQLNLRALYFDPSGVCGVSDNYKLNTFPGLFSLGKKETGRSGYLQLLGGLTKLKGLYGSNCLVTEETEATVGMDEIKWVDRHWVALETAHFGKGKQEGQECLDVLDWWDEVQRSQREL
ncbi:hypothetical protein KI688_011814 [Linnemannia hyalina]|uniref:Uncharacterized protein n=1 Tax=Linnemannia hyalina TaxID=64524 RepID=A0A9P7XYI5_9FUNG|nr:hypothetical protein KI688_011814 [Linnemannia hyalina]